MHRASRPECLPQVLASRGAAAKCIRPSRGTFRKHEAYGSFRKFGGTLFWGPYNKDPTILGTTVGVPYFRKLPYASASHFAKSTATPDIVSPKYCCDSMCSEEKSGPYRVIYNESWRRGSRLSKTPSKNMHGTTAVKREPRASCAK